MSEAAEKCASLDDIEEDTFIQFLQFAYTGDYTVPEPEIIISSSDIPIVKPEDEMGYPSAVNGIPSQPLVDEDGLSSNPNPELESVEDVWVKPVSSGKKDKRKKSKKKRLAVNPWQEVFDEPNPIEEPVVEGSFHARFGESPGPKKTKLWSAFKERAQVQLKPAWNPRANREACEEYLGVFLCHARLYIFSDRYGIESLQKLVLQKLRLTLMCFTLFPERVVDIVELVRYTYEHTMEYDGAIDKLKNLITDYVICHVEIIARNKQFRTLLRGSGALTEDIMIKMLRRLD